MGEAGAGTASSHMTASVLNPSINYDSITACTGQVLAPRLFDRSRVAKFFRHCDRCFVCAKILRKKVCADAIDFAQISLKSELASRFLGRLKF